MSQEYESRGYLLDDYRLFHLMDTRGTKVEAHYHEFCKLLMLRTGSGGYMVAGQRYSLEEGDIVLIGSHTVHRPEFESGTACERIIIYISPDFLHRQSPEDCPLEEIFSGEESHVLRPGEKGRKKLFALAELLEREMSNGDFGQVVLSNGLLLQLLVEIGRNIRSRAAAHPSPILPENGRVLDILRYIDAHLTEDLTIDHLSERFFISKYHMMRLFNRETGRSIHAYMTERRLLLARELIHQGHSATESCFRAGFRSYSSFTRAYGRRFGSTPTGRSLRMEETYE